MAKPTAEFVHAFSAILSFLGVEVLEILLMEGMREGESPELLAIIRNEIAARRESAERN